FTASCLSDLNTASLPDALPISVRRREPRRLPLERLRPGIERHAHVLLGDVGRAHLVFARLARCVGRRHTDAAFGDVDLRPGSVLDRKSTRLNSSHVKISYAVFC